MVCHNLLVGLKKSITDEMALEKMDLSSTVSIAWLLVAYLERSDSAKM